MADGFLGYKASFMLDVVVCALVLVVPTLLYSLYLVKFRKNFLWHRNIQVALGAVLLVTVGAFEVDLHLVHYGWEAIVAKREPPLSVDEFDFIEKLLWVHLVFAVTTAVLWVVTLCLAWKRFPSPPMPGKHSRLHKKLGWLSAIDITLTSVTGLLFYYTAFIA